MRILLAHNSLYFPAHGGGDKSNRLLMEALAERGHDSHVVARITDFSEEAHDKFMSDLSARGVTGAPNERGAVEISLRGVSVHIVTRNPQFRQYFADRLEALQPEVVITSTDDPAQLLFDLAVRSDARVVHLVRATIAAPFGPDSSSPSAQRTELLRRADAIVGVSEYVARYVREHGGLDAVHVPISLMEPGGFPNLADFESPFVTLVNPCAVKGIAIFLGLAERMPNVRFAAVPTWGANAGDFVELRRQGNIAILPPADDIDDILRQTRILLVPSLWAEARSRVVLEAMSRGVPVIASNVGGIPEAKLGVEYLLPVNPIAGYAPAVDENMVPVARTPPQDLAPWQMALERLSTDREHFEDVSRRSRRAALDYIRGLNVLPFESVLQQVLASPKKQSAPSARPLSAEKQKLLAALLKQKAAKAWFPRLEETPPGALRLFCFPHAGGGTMHYQAWQTRLASRIGVCPVRFPGRETRAGERPFERMSDLVDALLAEIPRHLEGPFAFFGHSMGAAVAFELIRALRSQALPLPAALLVSGARAPQFRLNHTPPPEPTEQEFLAELRRLEGVPAELLQSPDALRIMLPVLRADARLYRNYIYAPGEPLDIPIFAYGGDSDPNVRREHLEAWREQTGAQFKLRRFPGGHFFLQSSLESFLQALGADLQGIQAGVTGAL
jgi:surfactin synthase thioesterase subunit/glycosyltransferase involved in cell wall biosynthesis